LIFLQLKGSPLSGNNAQTVHFVKEGGSKSLLMATQRLLNAKMRQMVTSVFLRIEVMVSGELSLDMIHEINESTEEDISVAGFLPVWGVR
jgi:hypothetical protein